MPPPPSVHALDLPALYTKPSSNILLQTLSSLVVAPASFDGPQVDGEDGGQHDGDVARSQADYLTKIVKSPLGWIEDEACRERIWEEASRRLSERAGRNGEYFYSYTFWRG